MNLMKIFCRDWSSLPVDVINVICEFLPIPNRISFRMVCKSWHSAVPPPRINCPGLLLPGDGPDYGEYTDSFTFYSIPTNTKFKCPFPPGMDLSGTHCVGSQNGWLVLCDLYFKICLVNPLTVVRFDLPPFFRSPSFEFKYTRVDDKSIVLSGFCDNRLGGQEGSIVRRFDRKSCYIQKIVFCSDPWSEDFLALALFGAGNLAFLRGKEKVWHGITMPHDEKVEDIVYRGIKFWSLGEYGRITSFDLTREDPLARGHRACILEFDTHKFIAFDIDDKMYIILRHGNCYTHSDGKRKSHTKSFTVRKYKVGIYNDIGIRSEGEVKDLDGYSLLIGNNHSIFVSPEEYPYLRRNCVYVTSVRGKHMIFDMGVYDMEKKRFEPIYPNDMESNWAQPPPVWFEPNYKK